MFGWGSTRAKAAAAKVAPPDVAAPAAKPGLPPSLEAIRASRTESRHFVPPQVAAAKLVAWMQSAGVSEWITVNELQEAWQAYRDDLKAWEIPFEIIREQVQALPGVIKTRKRITSDPQFGAVRARLIAQARASATAAAATKKDQKFKYDDRPTLFYIPPFPDEDQSSAPRTPKSDRTARPFAGQEPVTVVDKTPAPADKTSTYARATPMAATTRQLRKAA